MATILETSYQKITIKSNEDLIIFYWKPSTEKMTDEEFLQELDYIANVLSTHAPVSKVLVITTDLKFIITPSRERKLNEKLLPVYLKSGVKKLAMVMPEGMLYRIAIENIIEAERFRHTFNTRFFDHLEHAEKWLNVEKKILIS